MTISNPFAESRSQFRDTVLSGITTCHPLPSKFMIYILSLSLSLSLYNHAIYVYIYLSSFHTQSHTHIAIRHHSKMGICSSSESSCAVATAKLILEDGRLQEYSYPVRVSYLLQKFPDSFICNSDEMGFDDVVLGVTDDEELQLGQIYFALPLSLLNRRLLPQDMAALAVKASSALGRNVVVFSAKNPPGNAGSWRRRGKFSARLNVIPE